MSLSKLRSKSPGSADIGTVLTERALRQVSWQMVDWLTKNGYEPSEQVSSFTRVSLLSAMQLTIMEKTVPKKECQSQNLLESSLLEVEGGISAFKIFHSSCVKSVKMHRALILPTEHKQKRGDKAEEVPGEK